MPGYVAPALAFVLLLVTVVQRSAAQTEVDGSRSTMAGVYSAAQALRGEETYMSVCVACHPSGTYATLAFKTGWAGRPLSELFEIVKEKMPKNDPGSLTVQEAAQVVAYLLKINDVPSGDVELPTDVPALKKIRFETPAIGEGKAGR
jgi:mono/diheme cytochrome c family protein